MLRAKPGLRTQPCTLPCARAGCEVESHEEFSLSMLAAGAAGLLLFYSASFLSTNFAFRMSCGTAFFSATFLALMLVVLFR